jgi:hypothetical protein
MALYPIIDSIYDKNTMNTIPNIYFHPKNIGWFFKFGYHKSEIINFTISLDSSTLSVLPVAVVERPAVVSI